MAELNGYLLTKEEEKACKNLIKEMRANKQLTKKYRITLSYTIDVEAPNEEKAIDYFYQDLDICKPDGELDIEELYY